MAEDSSFHWRTKPSLDTSNPKHPGVRVLSSFVFLDTTRSSAPSSRRFKAGHAASQPAAAATLALGVHRSRTASPLTNSNDVGVQRNVRHRLVRPAYIRHGAVAPRIL